MSTTPQSFSGESAHTADAKDFSAVLVLGGDAVAVQLAERLCEEGFSVVYVGEPEPIFTPENFDGKIECIANGVLKAIHGVTGAFYASIQTPCGIIQKKVGFVVVAQPPMIVPKYEAYGVKPENKVVRLSRFLEQLQDGQIGALGEADQLHIAFFAGLDGVADTATFAKIFDCIDVLITQKNVQCYVFTRHLKVAENGLEARYRRAREAGTLFFAFEQDAPVVEQTDGVVKIVFEDPHLSAGFELAPDILVLDEWLLPPDSVEPVCAMIPSSLRSRPYLTPPSPRFPSVETAKAGVFALGPARGEFYAPKLKDDIESVVGSLKKLITLTQHGGSAFVAMVESEKCTLCLTCVRTCPHGAIQFATSASVDENSCQGCGICVSECPMSAIALAERKRSPSDNSKEQRRVESAALHNGKLVAFLCEHSGANAYAELSSALRALVKPIVVPCAGAVGEMHVVQALLDGASGVLVAGCFDGNCASVYGTNRAAYRLALLQQTLAEAGLNKDRLIYVPLASNAPYILASAIEELLRSTDSSTQDSPAASMS